MIGGRRTPRARLIAEGVAIGAGLALLAWAWHADRRWFEVHTSWCYCLERPAQITGARVLRVVGAVVGLGVLLIGRPLVGRWAAARSAKASLASVARIAGAVLASLLVVEWVERRRSEPPILHFEPASQSDERLGWRPIPSHVTDIPVGDRTVRFVIDANDWRVRSPDTRVDFVRPTILSTGESVASGFGIDYDDTYSARLSERTGVQVVNVAVQGYASDASYLRLVDALPRFSHVIATVSTVLPLQIERMLWTDRPHLVPGDGGALLWQQPVAPRTTEWRLAHFFRRSIYHSDDAIIRTRAIIVASVRASRARGAFPLFVLVSWPGCVPDESGAPSIEHSLFDGIDVAHVRVDLPADVWDPITWHPGARGQAMIAEAIEGALSTSGVVR